MNDVQYLTTEGIVEMEARLKYLTEQKRMEVAERLRQALAEGGDLSENAEYEDAKNEQAFVEERTVDVHIRRLRQALEPTGYDKRIETARGLGYRFRNGD